MPQRNSSTLNIRNPIEVEMQKSKQRALSRDSVKLAQLTSQFIAVSDQLSQFRELYLRQRAEMENYAKARDREMEQLKKNAGRDIIKNILPILDTMDSALSNSKDYSVISPIREQLMKLLSVYGLSEIPGKGKKFDPYLHEVIAVTQSEEDGIIVEEVQKGYKLNNEVIRTSKVIVGKR